MLKIDHLKKQYGSFGLDCTMEVPRGSVTGLIGQNGAGKSTTFKAVLGLITADGGSVRLFGKDARSLARSDRQKIGAVLSDSGFSGQLDIRDVEAILGSLYDSFDRDYFRRLCSEYQLPYKKQIKDFSNGMKAKLKLFVAITHGASMLILDEPTAGLDVVARGELLDVLRSFMEQDEQRAILISSHISSDLEGLCDDLYMIHDGRIILHEETDVLLDDYAVLKPDPAQFEKLDRKYLLSLRKEAWGYSCLTNKKQFYMENYPALVVEKGSIDELMTMMVKGEAI